MTEREMVVMFEPLSVMQVEIEHNDDDTSNVVLKLAMTTGNTYGKISVSDLQKIEEKGELALVEYHRYNWLDKVSKSVAGTYLVSTKLAYGDMEQGYEHFLELKDEYLMPLEQLDKDDTVAVMHFEKIAPPGHDMHDYTGSIFKNTRKNHFRSRTLKTEMRTT